MAIILVPVNHVTITPAVYVILVPVNHMTITPAVYGHYTGTCQSCDDHTYSIWPLYRYLSIV